MFNMSEFIAKHGLKDGQAVGIVREKYPGYDKHLHSKIKSPDKYGVRLVPMAERYLCKAFDQAAPIARKRANRRLPARIQCRLTKRDLGLLQQALRRAGYKTLQDGLLHLITKYLQEQGGTETNG